MNIGCWAKSLGDCAGKLSGEHIVTESLWTGPKITVEGGPWGAPREIGIASLTIKVLCRSHNSRLSDIDIAGADAFRALTYGVSLANARKLIAPTAWLLHCSTIDGPRLERWFLKTAINVALLLKTEPTWAYDGSKGLPPIDLVRGAFGLAPIVRPLGLYSAAAVGDPINSQEEVRCHLLFDQFERLAAATFVFRGYNFVLHMSPTPIDGIYEGPSAAVVRSKDHLFYHLDRINALVNGRRSHFVDFAWPGKQFAHFGE